MLRQHLSELWGEIIFENVSGTCLLGSVGGARPGNTSHYIEVQVEVAAGQYKLKH